jgi:hypothetical protein
MAYKARPITSKACSPYKSDANLIQGAVNMGESKKFKDHSDGLKEKFSSDLSSKTVDHGKTQSEDEKKFHSTETSKGGQADNAI